MRTNPDIKLFHVGSDYFAVDMSAETVNYTHLYKMNEATAMLWEAFQGKDFDDEMMVDKLCEEYDVPRDVALRDVRQLLSEWQAIGMMV